MARAAIVLIENDQVALIRRERAGAAPFYLFPGGSVEAGETAEEAAVREAYEELGIGVRLEGLLAVVEFNGDTQRYFRAARVAGTFGTGQGAELAAPAASATGSYTPVWLLLDDLPRRDVRPRALAELVATRRIPAAPVAIADTR